MDGQTKSRNCLCASSGWANGPSGCVVNDAKASIYRCARHPHVDATSWAAVQRKTG